MSAEEHAKSGARSSLPGIPRTAWRRFAGTLRSPQNEMRSAHGWRQPELHFGEARTRFPASHEPPGGASREPCAHLRSKCASRMGGGSEFEKPVSIAKKITPRRCRGVIFWSGRRGSNSLPPPWQGGALPDELRPQMVPPVGVEPTTRGFSIRCSTN